MINVKNTGLFCLYLLSGDEETVADFHFLILFLYLFLHTGSIITHAGVTEAGQCQSDAQDQEVKQKQSRVH